MKKRDPKYMEDMDLFFSGRSQNQNRFAGYRKVVDKPEIVGPNDHNNYDIINHDILNLQGVPTTGSLQVSSNPTGAELFIINGNGNEIDMGATPITVTDIDPGSYSYIVRLSGYNDFNGTAQINAGYICCETVDLTASTNTENCNPEVTAPTAPTPGIPQSQPGYYVVREGYLFGGLGILAGIVIGAIIIYWLLKKRE